MSGRMERQLALASFAMVLALCALCGSVQAQQGKNVPRIGFLSSRSPDAEKSRLAAFRRGLKEPGYVEDKNIFIEQRYAEGDFDRLPALASELIRRKVDVLVVTGAPAAHVAKGVTTEIPIVMGNAADPVGTGLVASLARPGGNVTGLSDFNLALASKRLELFKEIAPALSRAGVFLNPANPTNRPQAKEMETAAMALRIVLLPIQVKTSAEIERAFATARKDHAGGLVVFGDPLLETNRGRIAELAAKNALPTMGAGRAYVEAGQLASYGTNFDDLYFRAATYVDKILKGAKPADLPVEQPTKFELVINLKTAKQIGLTIPPNVLARADRVIK